VFAKKQRVPYSAKKLIRDTFEHIEIDLMAKRGPGTPPKPAPPSERAVRPPKAAPPLPAKKKGPAKSENKPAPPKLSAAPKNEASEDLQVVFGENLKAARLKCGLKQSELAEPRPTISA
jgi:hypothetical protein